MRDALPRETSNCSTFIAAVVKTLRDRGPTLILDLFKLAEPDGPVQPVLDDLAAACESGLIRRRFTPGGWVYELNGVDIDAVHRKVGGTEA